MKSNKNAFVILSICLSLYSTAVHSHGTYCSACIDGNFHTQEEALAKCEEVANWLSEIGQPSGECVALSNNVYRIVRYFTVDGVPHSENIRVESTSWLPNYDSCPEGQTWYQPSEPPGAHGSCVPDTFSLEINLGVSTPLPHAEQCEVDTGIGHPINPVTGNKFLKEKITISNTIEPFQFQWTYNSDANTDYAARAAIGEKWVHNYSQNLETTSHDNYVIGVAQYSPITSSQYTSASAACTSGSSEVKPALTDRLPFLDNSTATLLGSDTCRIEYGADGTLWKDLTIRRHTAGSNPIIVARQYIIVHRGDGSSVIFDDSTLENLSNTNDTLIETTNGYDLVSENGVIESFDASGKLLSIESPSGFNRILSYDANGKLHGVETSAGESIVFQYNIDGLVDSITDHTNRVWSFSYDEHNNLSSVQYPDFTTKTYHYEDGRFPSALTGVTDRNNNRYSTYAYDSDGRATLTTLANNADRIDVRYDSARDRTVFNSRGIASIYKTAINKDTALITEISGPGCATCSKGDTYYDFDYTNNHLLSKTEHGIITQYGDYTAKDKPGYVIEASGTPEERRSDYTYDSAFPEKIATKTEASVVTGQNKVTTYSYDAFRNVTSVTVAGFAPDGTGGGIPVSRTVSYKYEGPFNQLSEIDGPRLNTEANDIAQLNYYPNDTAEGNNRAKLRQVIAPNGTLLRDNIQYTAIGKVASEERPNGVSLTYTYYPGNQRLETLTEASGTKTRTTRWTYLASGEVETITQAYGAPIATTVRFVYDQARRMTGVIDNQGNTLEYILDTEGNIEQQDIKDSNGVLYSTLQQTFDVYNRLDTRTLIDEVIDYNFSPDGSLDNLVDAKTTQTTYDYDALKRLTAVTGDVGGTNASTQDTLTEYVYDIADRLTSVTAPNGANTTYVYDDLGNLLSETSPDRGAIKYTYDAAGNVATMTDARGISVVYTYDELNRVTYIDYPGTEEDVIYSYDTGSNCSNGIGRLCQITDQSGVTQFAYDEFGNPATHIKSELGVTYTTDYSYDILNRMTSMTLPNGRDVEYGYNSLSQITHVDAQVNGALQTIVHNATYRPDGLLSSLEFGNGFVDDRQYNLKGRLTSQTMPVNALDYDGDGILDHEDLDDDNDGMPDVWELANDLVPLNAADASLDPDSDGINNLAEYQSGNDPNVPNTIPVSDVIWTDLVNTTDSGATLTKASGGNGWNAGAATLQRIEGDGAIETTVQQLYKGRMFGLSTSNLDANYASIDYALNLTTTSSLVVYEQGVSRGTVGTFALGDVLRVERNGTTVTYQKNGQVIYASTVPSSGTLIGDVSMNTVGSVIHSAKVYQAAVDIWGPVVTNITNYQIDDTIQVSWQTNELATSYVSYGVTSTSEKTTPETTVQSKQHQITLTGLIPNTTYQYQVSSRDVNGNVTDGPVLSFTTLPVEPVTWTDLVNTTVNGITLTKTSGGSGWNAGAASLQSIEGDGAIEITIQLTNKGRFIGLSSSNVDANYTSLDYSLNLTSGASLIVYESGISKGTVGSYTVGDVLRLKRSGTTVTYLKNGQVIYTSTVPSSGPLIGDVSMNTVNGTIYNTKLYGAAIGESANSTSKPIEWINLINTVADVNTLTKTAGADWEGAASSTAALEGDGSASFTIVQNTTTKILGMGSTQTAGLSLAEIDYALVPSEDGLIRIYESGVKIGSTYGSYAVGDELEIERVGSSVYYNQNNQTIFASHVASSAPLYVNAQIKQTGATITNAIIVQNLSTASSDRATNTVHTASTQSNSLVRVNVVSKDNTPIYRKHPNLQKENQLLVVSDYQTSVVNNKYNVFTIYRKGPETNHQWVQTAEDPNAYDRPDTVFYVSRDNMEMWQKGLEDDNSGMARKRVPFDALEFIAKVNEGQEPKVDEFIKVDHGTPSNPVPMNQELWTYTYDASGNVESIINSYGERIYGYDALNRMTDDGGIGVTETDIEYDRNGNRTSDAAGATTNNYIYLLNTNQLDADPVGAVIHDAAGNRTSDRGGNRSFEYNNAGRLWKVYEGGQLVATYTYNAMGQRTRQVTASGTIIYHYDLSGNLIAETTVSGESKRDYVYMGATPVAQIDVNGSVDTLSYLHTDHLGTPRRATSEAGDVVWSWDNDAFGKTAANDDADNDGISTIINLRFPGQYYDAESGLHYNYFRYYDPATGRYVTSDPIGLNGGLNTYGYVSGNPLSGSDFFGLRGPGTATGPSVGNGTTIGFPVSPGSGLYPPLGSNADFVNSLPPPFPYPITLDDVDTANSFTGRNGNQIDYDGNALSCNVDDKDRCRELLMRIYKQVYAQRTKKGSGTNGIAHRYRQQLADPGNLYENDRANYNRHNDQIREQQRSLISLLNEARKRGCYVPYEILVWSTINPPSKPRGY